MDNHSSAATENPACNYAISGIAVLKLDNIPAALKSLPQWVAWKAVDRGDGKKFTKVPVNPATGGNAMSNDPSTWASFEQAVQRATNDALTGIGLMFAGDDLVGVDLDDVRDGDGWTNPLAMSFAHSLDTYTEVSPSGRGVKMWLMSTVHPSRCTGTVHYSGEAVDYETYHKGRWFAVTGHVLPQYGGGAVQERTDRYARMLAEGTKPKNKTAQPAKPNAPAVPATGSVADEAAMLRAALRFLDADSEPSWFRYLCCLKNWGEKAGDPTAKGLCAEWSRTSPKWDEAAFEERWDRAEPDGGLTIGTIFGEAEDEGYAYGDAIGVDGVAYHIEREEPYEATMKAWIAGEYGPGFRPRPTVELPNIGGWTRTTITEAASGLGALFSQDGGLYLKSGVVVTVSAGRAADVDASALQSAFENRANLVVARAGKNEVKVLPTNATQGQAEAVLSAEPFRSQLPPLSIISKCPVIVGQGDGLEVARHYHRGSGVLVVGGQADEMPLDEAVALILDALSEFDFQSASDRSRGIAAMITPALVQGGLLAGRAPVDLSEADQSQSGKSFRAKLVAAVYNDTPHVVTQRKGGTGGIEESFSAALMNGESFISIENVRGRIDSQMIESALTEDRCDARVPYRRPQQVDMRRVCVMLTSNRAELTRDLSNRTSPVRIRKRSGHQFRSFGGLDLLGHVRRNQGLYLGAVFAVVRAWHAAGRPSTGETRHDFRAWAGTLDWIVRNLFGAAPLCDGIEEAKERMSSPQLNWLRDIALVVVRRGRCGEELMTWEIVRLAHEEGVEVPGLDEGADLEDDATMNKANQGVGRRLGHLFGERDSLSVDGHEVARQSYVDGQGRMKKKYVFRQAVPAHEQGVSDGRLEAERAGQRAVPPIESPSDSSIGGPIGGTDEITAECGSLTRRESPSTGHGETSPYTAPYTPPSGSPMKTQCSPIPPMGGGLLPEENSIVGGVSDRSGSQECEPIGGTGGKRGEPGQPRKPGSHVSSLTHCIYNTIPMAPSPAANEMPDDTDDETFLTEDWHPDGPNGTAEMTVSVGQAPSVTVTASTVPSSLAIAEPSTFGTCVDGSDDDWQDDALPLLGLPLAERRKEVV